MNVNAHLNFPGTCREAFDFYAKTLEGRIDFAMTWGESPLRDQCGPAEHDRMIHMSMTLGDTVLTGADAPPDRFEKAAGMVLSLGPKTAAEAQRLFAALSAGGVIQMPMQETFWSPAFGMATDRFGIPWMVSAEGQSA